VDESERQELLNRQFRFAQEPRMWHATGEDLVSAAEALVSSAMTKVAAYELAEKRALAECERIGAENGRGEGVAVIDAEPPDFLPAFLLYGYALENFLKGIIVAKDPSKIGTEKIGIPAIHSLVALAEETGFEIGYRDQDNLERLTVITTWSGRYPVARSVEKWQGVPLDRAAIFPFPTRSVEEIRSLTDRIRNALAIYCPPRDRRSMLVVHPYVTARGLTAITTLRPRR